MVWRFAFVVVCFVLGCAAQQRSEKPAISETTDPVLNLPVLEEAQELCFDVAKDEVAWRDRYHYLHSHHLDALVALGERAIGAIVVVWQQTYKEGGPEGLRWKLLEALLRIASPEAVPFLNYVLKEGENREKIIAARCALEWGDERNVAALIAQMDNVDVEVLCACAAALRRITGCYFGLERRLDETSQRRAAKKWKLWYQAQIRSARP
ncbi:MAG: hypothetical protein DRP63_01265 [Planctomycetota bacterium]|nr:MAG: hypothetical protein DRP63_01265 [Planctomycetota bacterium]